MNRGSDAAGTTDRGRSAAPRKVRRRREQSGPLPAGLAVSFLLHLLAVLLYRGPEPRFGAPQPPPSAPAVTPVRTMQVLDVIEVRATDPGQPEAPFFPEVATPEDEGGEVEIPASELEVHIPPRYRTAAERLILDGGDPRLWQPVDPALVEPRPEELLRIRIAELVELGNDSALAAAAELADAMDWTYTDDEGRRWGLSPGMVHLGDVAVPLPFGFGAPPPYNREARHWGFRLNDIQRAAGSLAARESWRQRAEAMRKRREAERERREGAAARPPPVVVPDTTSRAPRTRR